MCGVQYRQGTQGCMCTCFQICKTAQWLLSDISRFRAFACHSIGGPWLRFEKKKKKFLVSSLNVLRTE